MTESRGTLPPECGVCNARVQGLSDQERSHRYCGYVITADTDAEAIEKTKPLVDGHDIELWLGPRFIMAFKSKAPADGTKETPGRGQLP